jgi:hypothetical protein
MSRDTKRRLSRVHSAFSHPLAEMLESRTLFSAFPTWLDPSSVATWDDATKALDVTGAAIITADPGSDEPIITETVASANLSFTPASNTPTIFHIGSLTLSNGAVATATSLGSPGHFIYDVVVVGTSGGATPVFSISTTGRFDLEDNDLIVNYSGSSPLATISDLLATGFNSGSWDGNGIASGIAHNDPSSRSALGYAQSGDLGVTSFDSEPVSSAVIVKFTSYGDNNLDGVVDVGNDFGLFIDGLSGSGSTWLQGDYTYDGKVDLGNDFNLFLVSFLSAPVAPTNLLATTVSTTQIDLTWDASAAGGAKYNVYRGTDSEFSPSSDNLITPSPITTNSFSDTAAQANTRYYYRVTSVVNGRESVPDNLATEVTAFGTQPANLQTFVEDEEGIELNWDDTSSNETGFTVEARDSFGNLVASDSLPADADSDTFSNLSPETDYTFSVQANFSTPAAPVSPPSTTATTFATDEMTGLIILIYGHGQTLNSRSAGITTLANEIRDDGRRHNITYRVWRVPEFFFIGTHPAIDANGRGTAFDRASALLENNSVQDVAIAGYSHGGGLVYKLAQNLIDTRRLGQVWGIRYTATIDAIIRGDPLGLGIDNWLPAFAETHHVNSEHEDNFYNTKPFNPIPLNPFTPFNPLKGAQVIGANNNYARPDDTHFTIQDDFFVHQTIRDLIGLLINA